MQDIQIIARNCLNLFQANRTDQAYEIVKHFHQHQEPNSISLLLLGMCFYRLGEQKKALIYLRQAISLDPQNPSIYYNAARVGQITGDDLGAYGFARRAMMVQPNFPHARVIGACSATRASLYPEAAELFEPIASELPSKMKYLFAEALLRSGMVSRARDILLELAYADANIGLAIRMLKIDWDNAGRAYALHLVRHLIANHEKFSAGWVAELYARLDFPAAHRGRSPDPELSTAVLDTKDQTGSPQIFELDDVDVIGGDTTIFKTATQSVIFEHGMHSNIGHLAWTQVIEILNEETCLVFIPPHSGKKLESGIWLIGANSNNYFHFIYEMLPRLILADTSVPSSVPILVDAMAYGIPQIREAVDLVNGGRREVIVVGLHERIGVSRLYSVWGGVDLIPGIIDWRDTVVEDNIIHPDVCALIRRQYSPLLARQPQGLKLFLGREDAKNRCVNEQALLSIARSRGFTVVNPAKLTFQEQVELFSNAAAIVAVTGAALANIVFMPPGSRLVVAALRHQSCGMWSSIARAVGVDITIIDGEIVETANLEPYVKYRTDPDVFRQALDAPR